MKTVAVVGSGTMGNGIAHVFAQYGFDVIVVDSQAEQLEKAQKTIAENLDRQIKKGTLAPQDKELILKRLSYHTSLDPVSGADLVIEAIYEDYEAKAHLWQKVSALASQNALLATNTSSISITRLACQVRHPERFIGMHFMNPVPVMKLVEVIEGHITDPQVTQKILSLAQEIQKSPVVVKDYPGFISNRILMPMINEAIYALWQGVATREAIDTIMKLGMNHPMGPLQLADFIGLDVCLSILRVLHEGFGDPKYAPCPLLVNMVAAGQLGRKSGKGFYSYD
ncbi:MAG: 3-hydroxyacyl-CoA dehydrogenase family protein [Bacteroidia bacterium]